MTTFESVREKAGVAVTTALRIVVGVIMTVHGWGKLQRLDGWIDNVAAMGVPFPEVSGRLAVAGELLGGLGLLVGLLTPIAALGILSVMITAIVKVHWGNGLLAKNDGFEFPLTLAAAALFFLVRGPGPLSLDRVVLRLRDRIRGVTPLDPRASSDERSEPEEASPQAESPRRPEHRHA